MKVKNKRHSTFISVERLTELIACGETTPAARTYQMESPEFGWKQFEAPPIQHEAAARIERLEVGVTESFQLHL